MTRRVNTFCDTTYDFYYVSYFRSRKKFVEHRIDEFLFDI